MKDLKEYEGDHVRLIPIVRGINDERGGLAYVVWCAIEAAGDWEKIFWSVAPDIRKGDLFHWVSYLMDEKNPVTPIVFECKHSGALAAVFWFNGFDKEKGTAEIHFWIAPAFRGHTSREIGLLATKYAFEVLNVKRLIGISPHPVVRNYGLRCGYKETDRGDYDIHGMTRTIYKIEKENPNGQVLPQAS